MVLGSPLCSSRNVAMVFLNAIVDDVLHVFACFCNISFVFMHFYAFMRLCVVLAFVACVGTMHGAWYWYACHASHHHHMFVIMFIMFIMFIMMMIIDHHHVHCSLIID
jgi:Kef-type K+ transport system membrane component KefB